MVQDIWTLERDREKYEKQAKESAGRHADAMEQVELRELAIADIQKKVTPRTCSPLTFLI